MNILKQPAQALAGGVRRSWTTTAAGIVAGLTIILPEIQKVFDNDAVTVADWNAVVLGVMIAFGLAAARDNNVSSEDAGAKKG